MIFSVGIGRAMPITAGNEPGSVCEPRVASFQFADFDSLDRAQRTRARYAVDSPEWRRWMNTPHTRPSIRFLEMNRKQRDAAFGLLQRLRHEAHRRYDAAQ